VGFGWAFSDDGHLLSTLCMGFGWTFFGRKATLSIGEE